MIGIGATYVYPILQSRISTLRTGIWSIWSQVLTSLNLHWKFSIFLEGVLALIRFPIELRVKFQFCRAIVFVVQWTCLLVCVASIWVKNGITSAYMLMGGVAASRLGLWMFDLSVIQQMQVSWERIVGYKSFLHHPLVLLLRSFVYFHQPYFVGSSS